MAMDLITSPTIGTAIGAHPASLTRSPDSDTETPPPPPHQAAKRVLQNHHHAPPAAAAVSYKECLKNHAASIGGHALDGCCEFMPGPTASASDPTSLKCAACGCHRNFHRRDPDDPAPLHHHPPARRPHSPPSASQLLLSLSGQSPSRPSEEINPTAVIFGYHHQQQHPNNNGGGQNGNNSHGSMSRKRFRTKFSQEQKEKMYEFSEKIGWKLRKGEEKLVEDFCKEVGVVRGVFKVWMHNNKHSSSSSSSMRREKDQPPSDLLHLHQHHEQQNHNNINININNNTSNNNNNNNGSCGSVVDHHQFYATNGAAQQEAQ